MSFVSLQRKWPWCFESAPYNHQDHHHHQRQCHQHHNHHHHYIIDSQYITAIYDMNLHTAQQLRWQNFGKICTHDRHRIPSPYGPAMGCLLWVIKRKLTALYRKRTVLSSTSSSKSSTSLNSSAHLPKTTYSTNQTKCFSTSSVPEYKI